MGAGQGQLSHEPVDPSFRGKPSQNRRLADVSEASARALAGIGIDKAGQRIPAHKGPALEWLRLAALLTLIQAALLIVAAPSFTFAAQPPNSVSIADHGATPDDDTDDTAAIAEAIVAAQSQRKAVYIPSGIWLFTTFRFNGIALVGEGANSVLYAPIASSSMIILNGDGPSLANLKVHIAGVRRTDVDHAIFIERATNFTISRIEVMGAQAGGIVNYGGSKGRIINNYIHDTFADAIHNTLGASDTVIANNRVRNSGDDMIAVVSYIPDGIHCRNILIQNNNLANLTHGRGISVVGGRDITIKSNSVAFTTCCAGIIIASEPHYNTYGGHNILVQDNLLLHNGGSTGHGAIMISALNPGHSFARVMIKENVVAYARHDGIKLEGQVADAAIIGNSFTGSGGQAINLTSGSNLHCQGNIVDGSVIVPLRCNDSLAFSEAGSSLTYVKPEDVP